MDFFRPDFAACRELFLQLGEGGDELIHAVNPAPGPDGLELSTEFLRLGPGDAERALILVSGTHGAEGFAGSAVQSAWLAKYTGKLPDNLAVVMVHGLNAFGFAHLRRVNENNVDLNRNFIDHEGAHPYNEGYAKIGAAMAARALDGSARTEADVALAALREEMGQMNVMRAIGGQYDAAEGMFYGGRVPVWSNSALREHLPRLLPNVKLAAYVDIHTGLGPSGHGSAMGYHHKDTADYDLAQKWWGAGMTATASKINHGKTGNGAIEALSPARVICLTLEFGTLPFSDVLAALRDEHALWWHGEGRDGTEIKAAMKSAFYRNEIEWKNSVIERGLQVADDSIQGLDVA